MHITSSPYGTHSLPSHRSTSAWTPNVASTPSWLMSTATSSTGPGGIRSELSHNEYDDEVSAGGASTMALSSAGVDNARHANAATPTKTDIATTAATTRSRDDASRSPRRFEQRAEMSGARRS